jgi:hypothetical protein
MVHKMHDQWIEEKQVYLQTSIKEERQILVLPPLRRTTKQNRATRAQKCFI